jgi:hypothetical protein
MYVYPFKNWALWHEQAMKPLTGATADRCIVLMRASSWDGGSIGFILFMMQKKHICMNVVRDLKNRQAIAKSMAELLETINLAHLFLNTGWPTNFCVPDPVLINY